MELTIAIPCPALVNHVKTTPRIPIKTSFPLMGREQQYDQLLGQVRYNPDLVLGESIVVWGGIAVYVGLVKTHGPPMLEGPS
jgi:hypothetical protein